MASRTRVNPTTGEVAALVAGMLGSGARVVRAHRLTGGTVNTCLGITLADGREVVLKLAPPPGLAGLRYERDLMRTEIDFLHRAGAAGVPVPQVLAEDFGRRSFGSDCFLMSRARGRPLNLLRPLLPRPILDPIRRELGRMAARIGTLEGPAFGYPSSIARATTWRGSLGLMFQHLLDDATRYQVTLPVKQPAIASLLSSCASALDLVSGPRLVHFDLWDGNILVELGTRPRLSCILDAERAFYGDPYAEFASLALYGDIAAERAVLSGWEEEAGRRVVLDAATCQRVLLAQLYLYLIMRVEVVPRGVHALSRFASDQLVGIGLRRVLRRLKDFGALIS